MTVQSLCLLNVSKDVTLFLSKLDSIVEGEAADAYVQSLVYPSGKPINKQVCIFLPLCFLKTVHDSWNFLHCSWQRVYFRMTCVS